jgi:hypothetical protein
MVRVSNGLPLLSNGLPLLSNGLPLLSNGLPLLSNGLPLLSGPAHAGWSPSAGGPHVCGPPENMFCGSAHSPMRVSINWQRAPKPRRLNAGYEVHNGGLLGSLMRVTRFTCTGYEVH